MQLVLLSALLLIKIALVRPCEPDFGTDYPGCDIKQKHDVQSWKECSRICSYTTNCKYWTWAHADSTVSPLTCWLKHSKCPIKLSSNLVSGDTNCPTKSLSSLKSFCLPKYGLDFPGCDMKSVQKIKDWRECSLLCLFTQGCKQWTWSHKGFAQAPHNCWLKNKICVGKPLSYVISGDVLTYIRCKEVNSIF